VRGDLGIGGRHDLGAVVVTAEVDLVAVVVRRVVRSGHHDAGRDAEVANGERQHRSGQEAWEQDGPDPGARHHLGGVAGEDVGVLAPVEADHDGRRHAGHRARDEVGRETCGGLGDQHPIHPVRAGGDLAAEPGGAECETGVEAIGEIGGCGGITTARTLDELGELGSGLGIGILRDPGLGQCEAFGVAVVDVLRHPCS
jgi:hypothetical protein